MVFGAAGLALAVIGLAALWAPVGLNQHDLYGFPVGCGNGFSADLSQAAQTHRGDLVMQCDAALFRRRAWAIPSVALGWLLVTTFVIAWAREAP